MIKPHGGDILKPLFVENLEERNSLIEESASLPDLVLNSAAAANAVTSGGTYTHNFASADANGLSQQRDWAHNNYIPISDVTTNTFSVQLLQKIPSTNTTTHVFQSALANSIHRGVIQKQNGWITMNVGTSSNTSWHGFKSADSGALISGGYYAHSFVSASTGAVHTGGDYTHEFVSAVTNGIKRQDPAGRRYTR